VKPGGWRSRSSARAVPLSRIQTDILRLLAAPRDPESYVAGVAPQNRDAPCISGDNKRASRSGGAGAAALAMEKLCCRSGASLQGRARPSP
jgi:hypothetical protein